MARCRSTCASSAERDRRGVLDRTGDHETGVAADRGKVRDEVRIAREESDPEPGEIRPLRERVDGDHAFGPMGEDRPPGAVPGELDVALVGEDRHAPRPSPRGRGRHVLELTSGVAGAVEPETQRPGHVRVARSTRGPCSRRAATGPGRPGTRRGSRPSRRSDTRAPGAGPCRAAGSVAAANAARRRRAPSFRHRRRWPRRRRGRRTGAPSTPTRPREAPPTRPKRGTRARPRRSRAPRGPPAGGGSHGVPIDRSTSSAVVAGGELREPAQLVERVHRRHEALAGAARRLPPPTPPPCPTPQTPSRTYELRIAPGAPLVEACLHRARARRHSARTRLRLRGGWPPGRRPGRRGPPAPAVRSAARR